MSFTIVSRDVADVPAIQSVWYDVDLAILAAGLGGAGVVSGCGVTAQGSPDMTVAVAAGKIRTAAGVIVVVASGNLTIDTAHASNPRVDLITAAANGTKTYTAGTAAASPKPPALPAGHIALAYILVPATDTTIGTSQITDKKVPVAPWAPWAICQGRLTLTTGVPVTTSDVTAATTLYFTPFRGNWIGLFDGTNWNIGTFTEKSISLAGLTASLPYDVFMVDGTQALELVAWTNVTTRATALVLQDGILVKTGATTRRYLGTICITGTTGQCEDSAAKRLVWNYYNRIEREMHVFDATDNWNYSTATWRAANGTTTDHQLAYVCGVSEDPIRCEVGCQINADASTAGSVGIGIDSTSANSAQIFTEIVGGGTITTRLQGRARYRGWPGIGSHTLTWIEYARAATVAYGGDGGVADQQSGILAEVMG